MALERQHIDLKECRPCVCLKQDTFAGVLSTAGVNNVRMSVQTPLAYFRKLHKELNEGIAKSGRKGKYAATIKVNPQDQRSFLSAEFRYGRRVLTYTNVASLPNQRTKQEKTFVIKETSITAIRFIEANQDAKAWAESHGAQWNKQGYKGRFNVIDNGNGVLINGNFRHNKEDKTITVTSRYDNKKLIVKLVQIWTYAENIQSKDKPQYWIKNTHAELTGSDAAKGGFTGSIKTYVDANGQLVITGKYTKSVRVDNGNNNYEVIFYNKEDIKPDMTKPSRTDTSDWRPTVLRGKSYTQVRSIAQDDEYTPQYRKGLTQRQEIQSEYHRYLKDMHMLDRVQLVQREIEYIKSLNRKQKVAKPVDQAKRWMQSVLKSNPDWFLKANAVMLVMYCKDCITKGVMTAHEATQYCEQNAK